MQKKYENKIAGSSGNVFADLGLPQAGALQVKAELTRQIYKRIKTLKLTQAQAAKRLGLKQPDVSKLCRGRYPGFSLERLIKLLNTLDLNVEIILHPPDELNKKSVVPGTVRVLAKTS